MNAIEHAAIRFVAKLMHGSPDPNDLTWAEEALREDEYGYCLVCLAEPRHEPDCPLVGLVRATLSNGVAR
jgi:hypothetical protein